MQLKKLELSNFFSFGESQTIDFDSYKNLVLVKGETADVEASNGAGKSSLFEAVFWCLTGRTVRGVRAGDVVRIGEKSVYVSVDFTIKSDEVNVTRRWSADKKTVTLTVNGEEEDFHDARQGTARIFEYLSISPEILSLIGFYGRKFNTFSDLSPKERAEVIDLLAQGDKWEEGRENAATHLKEINSKYDNTKDELERVGRQIEEIQQQIKVTKSELIDSKEAVAESIKEKKAELSRHEKELKESKAKLKEIEGSIFDKDVKIKPIEDNLRDTEDEASNAVAQFKKENKSRDTKYDDEVKESEELLDESKSYKNELKSSKYDIAKKIEEKRSQKGKVDCTSCGQRLPHPPDNEKIEKDAVKMETKELAPVEKEISELDEDLKGLVAMLSDMKEKEKERVGNLVAEERKINSKFDERRAVLAEKKNKIINEYNEVCSNIELCKKDVEILKGNCDRAHGEIERLENSEAVVRLEATLEMREESEKKAQKEKKEKEKELPQLVKESKLASYWSQGFKDLRFSTFQNTINILEELLTSFAKQQGLDFDKIEVTAFKEKSDGGIRPEVNIHVIRKGERMSLDSLSEGETQRVDLACFFTFSLLIEKSIGFPINFAVLDEPLSGLDHSGRQNVFSILSDMSKNKQMFTIDHDANFQDLFSSVIVISKDQTSTIN